MKPIKTTDLDKMLTSMSADEYLKLKSNYEAKSYDNVSDYLNDYLCCHQLVLADVVRKSGISRDYAYAIMNGHKKKPSRDYVLALCLAMEMNLEDTNHALIIADVSILYSKKSRDALIIICINQKQYDISVINELLEENGEKPIH